MMPKISVIVPVYNAKETINACVDSILRQSFEDIELILVDDGSPDISGTICDAYAVSDCRIRVIHKKNGGVSAARNAGLDIAQGEYVLFVDSDDWIDSQYVQTMYNARMDLTICSLNICRKNGKIIQSIRQKDITYSSKEEIDFPGMYSDLALYSPYCKLFRRDIIEKYGIRFPNDISWGEDGMFVADYLAHVQSVRLLEFAGYYYIKYEGEGNLSTKVRENIIEMVCVSREYCITRVGEHAPWAMEETALVCSEDIRCNCAGFVSMLLQSKVTSVRKKKKLMACFGVNSYVQATFAQPYKYYSPNLLKYIAIGSAERMVVEYVRDQRRAERKERLYQFYDNLPQCVKMTYRRMKGWIQK